MIEAGYDRNRDYDVIYEKIIGYIREGIGKKDDDFLLLYAGSPGTGKSTLMLHGYELYDTEGCNVEYIGFDPKSHAQALKNCEEKPLPRFCADDEANVNRRAWNSTANRDKIDLYLAIRGLNIFHAWCNPSVDLIDKFFIEERIKGLIYIVNKESPRIYYYFRKQDLLQLYEKHGNLKLRTLEKFAKQYAYYKGWFKDYNGKLKKSYLERKGSRMSYKVNDYYKKYGEETYSQREVAAKAGIHEMTVSAKKKQLIKEGFLVEGEHYYKSGAGLTRFTDKGLEVFRKYKELLS